MAYEQQSSEVIMQFLFAFEFSDSCDEELIPVMMKELKITKQKTKALFDRALTIWQQRQELDQMIRERSCDYDFSRIGGIEKGILRHALFTLQDKEQKATVVLKEAMRLAKKFSTPHSAKFVNAILDQNVAAPCSSSAPSE